VVRDVGDHDRQKEFIRQAIVRYLRSQPRDADGKIVLQAYDQSDAYFSLDEASLNNLDHFVFSTETEVFRGRQAPFVETILNRPLRFFRDLPGELQYKLDLLPEATQDLGGRCVAKQLIYCVTRRARVEGKHTRERLWKEDEDLEPLLDEIEHRMYPGMYDSQELPQPPDETEERRRHREALSVHLPAWKREGDASCSWSCPPSAMVSALVLRAMLSNLL
jgi:hypothetical protein